jgi:hypothetical protein
MISEHIRRNTCYFIFFNQADSESAYWAAKILQIDERSIKLLSSLRPGICVFRQTQTSCSNAFLVKIDFIAPARNIGKVEYSTHNLIPATDKEFNEQIIHKLEQSFKPEKKSDVELLALKLLKLRSETPYCPVVRLFEKLGKIRHETQIRIRELLENKKLAEFENPRIGSKQQLLMEITEAGLKLLGIEAENEKKGRGSITHRHYAFWILMFFQEQGHKAYVEHVIPGTTHPVDVAIEIGNTLRVFEISVAGTANIVSHVEACFDKASIEVESVTIITGQQKDHKKIRQMIKSSMLLSRYKDRIVLDVIGNFMPKAFKKEPEK